MDGETEVANGFAFIEAEMRRMVAHESPPYDCALNIWAKAMSLIQPQDDVMHPLWLVWGALTDWIEVRPEEQRLAEQEMLRAAHEWLALDPNDAVARRIYFERWVYDELGYEERVSE